LEKTARTILPKRQDKIKDTEEQHQKYVAGAAHQGQALQNFSEVAIATCYVRNRKASRHTSK